mgnify:CR=1 FL=1
MISRSQATSGVISALEIRQTELHVLDGITDEHERKEVSNMANTTDPILHVEIVQGVSKAGKPYECLEVLLGEDSVGRLFPTPLEMRSIKAALQDESDMTF